jgi:hypothetical protein
MNTPITFELLQQFCESEKPKDKPFDFTQPFSRFSYHGDGTEENENKIRSEIGYDKYQQYHYDTIACNRWIIIYVPHTQLGSCDPEAGARLDPSLARTLLEIHELPTTSYYLITGDPDEQIPADDGSLRYEIKGRWISAKALSLIRLLPDVQFVGPVIDGDIGAPVEDLTPVYFRFNGGAGAVMPLKLVSDIQQIKEEEA